jgi:alkylhydroperoxidase family enzyme
MDIGSAVGRASGVTVEQLEQLPDYRTSAAFSEEERLALELADAMARQPAPVPDELFARLRARFDEPQLVELAAAIAWENYRSRFNRVFDIQSDDFSEGAFCAIPVRASGTAAPSSPAAPRT